jgi:hypothetical protein
VAGAAAFLQQRTNRGLIGQHWLFGTRSGGWRAGDLGAENLPQGWRIETGVLPGTAVARAVRAEGGVIRATRVLGRVAI